MCGQLPPNQRRSTIGDRRAELARLVGGRLAGRAGADDHEVEGRSMRVSLCLAGPAVALAARLVQQHGRA